MNLEYFNQDKINLMEKHYRAAFINSMGGFKSIALVGTINNNQQTNLAIFSSIIHIGSNPPLFGIIIRPDIVERHTLQNIEETGVYTINHINSNIYKQAHQTAARYPQNVSEFTETGLIPEFHQLIKAPYVKQSNLKFGLQLVERVDIKINGTVLLIGKVLEAFLPENCISPDGLVDLEKADTLTLTGLDSYYKARKIARLSYPETDLPIREI